MNRVGIRTKPLPSPPDQTRRISTTFRRSGDPQEHALSLPPTPALFYTDRQIFLMVITSPQNFH